MKKHPFFRWMSAFLIAFISFNVAADISAVSVNVNVTIEANNCRVNENKPVTAEFGTVLVDQIAQAKVKVPIVVACDIVPNGTLSMAIKGTESSFNKQALQTDVSGLAITLSSPKSEILDLNTYYDVTKSFGLTSKTGSFDLIAQLTQDNKVDLSGGEFNASATLVLQIS
ncbi:fimbrial protein [Salmonella enterica]